MIGTIIDHMPASSALAYRGMRPRIVGLSFGHKFIDDEAFGYRAGLEDGA
jgi:hypothetical protein